MAAICVYCGSSPGDDPAYARAARELGEILVRDGHTLVYGGSNVGLMAILADTVLARGGQVIGVIPTVLVQLERVHRGVADMRIVETMAERRRLMLEIADAFIAMPGGIGTLDELTEAMVMNQLGLHLKPCGLLNTAGYFDPLIEFFRRMVEARFFRAEQHEQLIVRDDPAALIPALLACRPRPMSKWMDEHRVREDSAPGARA